MTDNDYLSDVLSSQNIDPNGAEMKELHKHREKVETLLRKRFVDCSPTIRYGGSKAKGTMILESYDLDIICYFPHDDTTAGDSLEDIYNNTHDALRDDYIVERKGSALRLKGKDAKNCDVDFHVDVVPGRFIDDEKNDVFLYRATGNKKRLKTNLETHISHVKNSGVIDAIRLMKLWKVRNYVPITNFILELLVIELLKARKNSSLSTQLKHVLEEFRDNSDGLSVEDPANPDGNDLSDELNDNIKSMLSSIAHSILQNLESGGWEEVFGKLETQTRAEKIESLKHMAATVAQTKPWYNA